MSEIRVSANQGLQGGRLLDFEVLPSTQAYARAHAATLQHGDVIWARHQTQGRGRFDRIWQAAAGRSLAFSLVLKQPSGLAMAPATLQFAALAICTALRAHHVDAGLKWPNDVVTRRGKIAGLLADGIPEAKAMALGIGINVNMTRKDFAGLPVSKPATSIRIETRQTPSVRKILDDMLAALEHKFNRMATEGAEFLPDLWTRYDTLMDQRLTVHAADGQTLEGLYQGMDPGGALRLEDDSGKIHVFWSGDVSLSPPDIDSE